MFTFICIKNFKLYITTNLTKFSYNPLFSASTFRLAGSVITKTLTSNGKFHTIITIQTRY